MASEETRQIISQDLFAERVQGYVGIAIGRTDEYKVSRYRFSSRFTASSTERMINAEFDAGFGVFVHLHIGFGNAVKWHDGIDQALGG